MPANMYDAAYELEKSIRQSDEFDQLKKAYQAVFAEEASRTMFENFRNLQMDLQQKQMMGQEIMPEEVDQSQKLLALVQQNPRIAQLMEAEMRLSTVIADINNVIMKPLEELYTSLS